MTRTQLLLASLCCAIFLTAVFTFGSRLAHTEIHNYDGLLFHADTAEVADDITTFQTPRHRDTNVHPLFVLFVNPPGVLLSSILPRPYAVLTLNAIFGALLVWISFRCFISLGLTSYPSFAWSLLTGSSACHLLFATIPERHIMASLTLAILCLVAITHPGNMRRFVIAGILTLAITVTNVLQCALLYLSTLLGTGLRKQKVLTRVVSLMALVLVISVLLSLVQSWIWPDARFFFLPEVYGEESAFFLTPNSLAALARKAGLLVIHMFCFNISAPSPLLQTDTLTFDLRSLGSYSLVGLASLSLWFTVILVSGFLYFRNGSRWKWFQAGILLCLLFNLAMHMLYGDDFFIYAANWTFPVLALVAAPFGASRLRKRPQILINVLLTALVLTTLANNCLFMTDVSSYLEGKGSTKWKRWKHDEWKTALGIQVLAGREGINTIYADRNQRWLTYATDRALAVVGIASEPSRPIRIAGELESQGYGFLDNQGGVVGFIRQSGGTCRQTTEGPYQVAYAIRPPTGSLTPVPGALVTRCDASTSPDDADLVNDLNMDTAWTPSLEPQKTHWLEIQFSKPVSLAGVRLFANGLRYPKTWRIETKTTGQDPWVRTGQDLANPHFFWSGPRLYWAGKQFSLAARFPAVAASAIRIVFPDPPGPLAISEVMVYSPGSNDTDSDSLFPDFARVLEAHGIERLYAERWVCNDVKRRLGSKIITAVEPRIFGTAPVLRSDKLDLTPFPIRLSQGTAILVRQEYASITEECLKRAAIPMTSTLVAGAWALFAFEPNTWNRRLAGFSRLYWASTTCLMGEANWATKQKAAALTQSAMAPGLDDTTQTSYLINALVHYPNYQAALDQFGSILLAQGQTEQANEIRSHLSQLRQPDLPVPIRFGKNIELLGVTLPHKTCQPGDRLQIQYFWKCRPEAKHHQIAAFVHFRKDGKERLFQGDHVLCERIPVKELRFQPFDEVFRETYDHDIPAHVPEGDYQVFLGLYDRNTDKRLPARTKLPTRKNSVTLPVTIHVEATR